MENNNSILPSLSFALQQNYDDFELFLSSFTNTTNSNNINVSQQQEEVGQPYSLSVPDNQDPSSVAAEETNRRTKGKRRFGSSAEGDENQRRAHREVERKRRQDMATLYASLRNELPVEYLRGKRSISDHIREAVRYIEQKQKTIRELETKRDNILKWDNDAKCDEIIPDSIMIKIQPCRDGVEILINCGSSLFRVSSVLQLLHQERFNVVSYVCSNVEGSLFHTIRAEVSPETSTLDLQMLRQKVTSKIQMTLKTN